MMCTLVQVKKCWGRNGKGWRHPVLWGLLPEFSFFSVVVALLKVQRVDRAWVTKSVEGEE